MSNLIKHPSVILIIGGRDQGKTALGHNICETFYKEQHIPIYVISPPKLHDKLRRLLPEWIAVIDNIEEAPEDSIILVDEAAIKHHSHQWRKKDTEIMDSIISLSRQRKQTIIFITHTMRKFAVTLLLDIDVLLCKKPSLLHSKLERSEVRHLVDKVAKEFDKLPHNKVKKNTYVISDSFNGFIQNDLPSFWSEQLSEAYATNRNNQKEGGIVMSKEDLDIQIQETEQKIHELKEKETKGPRVKKTSIILSSDGKQMGSISFFDDLRTVLILGAKRYTGEGEKAFWYACGYAASLGNKIHHLRI